MRILRVIRTGQQHAGCDKMSKISEFAASLRKQKAGFIMNDFSRIHSMNALTTSANVRKRRRWTPMLLVAIATGVTLVALID